MVSFKDSVSKESKDREETTDVSTAAAPPFFYIHSFLMITNIHSSVVQSSYWRAVILFLSSPISTLNLGWYLSSIEHQQYSLYEHHDSSGF